MKGEVKKAVILIGIFFLIITSVYAIVLQYQILDLKSENGNRELFVKILVDKTSGITPFKLEFTSLVINNIGEIESIWDFGDGIISNEKNPIHTYEKNGSYICSLTITDERGKTSSNSININSISNQKPTVSIEAETDKPRRPKSVLLEYILPKIIHIEAFWSNDYRELEKKGLLDPLFKNMGSFYSVEAFATDPDGDEIVFFNWTLRPHSYTTRLKNIPVDPVYNYYGKKIEIPAKHIYPATDYSLTLTVTDSKGEQRSENFKFTVEKSSDRATFEAQSWKLTNAINKWVSRYHDDLIVGTIVLGSTFIILKLLKKIIPEALSLPFGKLIFMIIVELVLQTSPDEYTDESYIDVIKRIVFKERIILKSLNPERFKRWFDLAEEFFKKISLMNLSEVFQLLEEKIGLDNNRPHITNPYPSNFESNINLSTRKIFVTVEDKEGDIFSVQIFDKEGYVKNSSGFYPMGQYNGSFYAILNNPLPPLTDITWNVLVIDQNNKIVNEEFKFTTNYD